MPGLLALAAARCALLRTAERPRAEKMGVKEDETAKVNAIGDRIRQLKQEKAAKEVIMAEVEKLKVAKEAYEAAVGEPFPAPAPQQSSKKKGKSNQSEKQPAPAPAPAKQKQKGKGKAAANSPAAAPAPAPAPAPSPAQAPAPAPSTALDDVELLGLPLDIAEAKLASLMATLTAMESGTQPVDSAADVLRDLKALRVTLAADTKKYQEIGSVRDKLAKEVAAAQKENSKLKYQIAHLKRACTEDAPAAKWFPDGAAAPVGDGEGRWTIAVSEVNGRFKLSVAAPNFSTFYGTRSGSGARPDSAAKPVSAYAHRFYIAVGMAVEAQRTSGGAWESAMVSGLPKDDLGSWELTGGDGTDKWKEMVHYSAIRARRKFAPPSAPAARGARADVAVSSTVNIKTPPAIAEEVKQMNTACDSLETRLAKLEAKGKGGERLAKLEAKGKGGNVAGAQDSGTDWRKALPAAQGVPRYVNCLNCQRNPTSCVAASGI